MTKEQLTEDIIKQLNAGFSLPEIKKDLIQKGNNPNEINNIINEITLKEKQASTNNTARYYAVLLIIIGIVLMATVKAVSGVLDFSFDSSGDARRWKELFFQPFGGLLLIILGIIILIRKKTIGVAAIRIIGIIWFSILTVFSAISNDLLTLLISLVTIFVIVKVTEKVSNDVQHGIANSVA